MQTERRVRLFKNGRNQALRIPKDLELPGDEAIIRKEGAQLIVKPFKHPSLLALLVTRLINFVQHSGKLIFAIANTFMQPWPEVL